MASSDAEQQQIDNAATAGGQQTLAAAQKKYGGALSAIPQLSAQIRTTGSAGGGNQAQANLAGANTSDQETSAGGIAGFFGAKTGAHQYTAKGVGQTGYDANSASLQERMAAIAGGQNTTMQNVQLGPMAQAAGTNAAGGNFNPQQQFRNQQLQLGNALMAQANGTGPSVAGAQLQQSTEQNLQAALAQAASSRGGNLGAMQYQLGNARANIQQQAAQQLAQNRMQEQMNAQNMLGGVLQQGRGADIDVGQLGQQNNQFNAQLGQQNNQFNAGQTNAGVLQQGQMNQATGQANLAANINQDQFRQNLLSQLQNGQISLDQYNTQLKTQQNQFNAGLLAQQEAAREGVSVQNGAQAAQVGGATIGAIGTIAAAAL